MTMTYFNAKTKFPHGIMFHHFHDFKKHKPGQGSISKNQLVKIINFVGRKNILNPDQFISKFKKKTLKKNHICFTFDDGCASQFDIAIPVLKKYKIKAFFFIYSSMFTSKPDFLEIYRYFRLNYFQNVDEFYNEFFKYLKPNYIKFLHKNKKKIQQIKKIYPHYSENDIKFRLIRNFFISKIEYKKIMKKLFVKKKFNPKKILDKVFMNKSNVLKIHNLGHKIGLHSHSHPTIINKYNFQDQLNEYKKNINILAKILRCKKSEFNSMSHPLGNYNSKTIKVLKKLNIDLGFIATMKDKIKSKTFKYNIPRQDHAYITKMV